MNTAQKIKFSIKDFLSKCDQICWKLRIWLLKKFLKENSIFCEVRATAAYWESSDITMSKETASAEILPEYETNKSLKRKENTNFQQKPNVIYIYYILMHSAQYRPLKDCYCHNSVYFIMWRYCTMMRNSKKKKFTGFWENCFIFHKKDSFYERRVRKGVSAPSPPPAFFFHPSPLYLETSNYPPFDMHQREIPDSMMIPQNQGDWKQLI